MKDFRTIATQITADIEAGRLRPGDRLPPQRAFAYERGIATSTAGRVYAELVRRGIVAGEVGRGTYVRAPTATPRIALGQPSAGRIDMETNYPMLPDQHRLMAPALAVLASRPDAFDASIRASSPKGTASLRAAAAAGIATRDWQPVPDSILFAGNGRQALATAFSALVPVGERIGFESLTYPVARAIATNQGIVAVPLATDADGVRPDAIEAAHEAGPLRAIYLQPTLHNPLGTTMSAQRRGELAHLLARLDGPIVVEDRVYAFLEDGAPSPLAAFAPLHVVVVDSLSKRVSPGLTLGLLSAPAHLVAKLARALITGAWSAHGFPLEIGVRWLLDGTVAALEAAKRVDARARQLLAANILAGLKIRANPAAYHLLLDLPGSWHGDAFVLAAEREGIAIAPVSAFAAGSASVPNTVRLALGSPTLQELASSLRTLAALVRSEMDPTMTDRIG